MSRFPAGPRAPATSYNELDYGTHTLIRFKWEDSFGRILGGTLDSKYSLHTPGNSPNNWVQVTLRAWSAPNDKFSIEVLVGMLNRHASANVRRKSLQKYLAR